MLRLTHFSNPVKKIGKIEESSDGHTELLSIKNISNIGLNVDIRTYVTIGREYTIWEQN